MAFSAVCMDGTGTQPCDGRNTEQFVDVHVRYETWVESGAPVQILQLPTLRCDEPLEWLASYDGSAPRFGNAKV